MSFGSQQSSRSAIPKWATPFAKSFIPIGEEFQRQGQSTESRTGGPQATGEQYYKDVVGGKYLNPDTNPYLSPTADIIRNQAQENLGRSFAGASRAGQGAGTLLSSATGAAKDVMARQSSQDVTNALTNLYGQNYAAERTRQAAAVPQLMAQDPYQKAMQTLAMFSGGQIGGTSSGSQMGVSIL